MCQPVKTCPMCAHGFLLNDFLTHADIRPIGMQLQPGEFALNLYYFNHVCPGCGSTFAVPVEQFVELMDEPVPEAILDGTEGCESHCRRLRDVEACSQPCHYAPFRRFLINHLLRRSSSLAAP